MKRTIRSRKGPKLFPGPRLAARRAATPHERIDTVLRTIEQMREWWGKEVSQLHAENNERKRDCVAALRGVTGLEAAVKGLRSDMELEAAFSRKRAPDVDGITGFAVPPIAQSKSDIAMDAWRRNAGLFMLRPEGTVSNASLLDFLKVYADDKTLTGKAIFAMAHELLSLRVK